MTKSAAIEYKKEPWLTTVVTLTATSEGKSVGGRIGKKMKKNDRLNLQMALENNQDNEPAVWVNSRGYRYQVVPDNSYLKNGKIRCRLYSIKVNGRGRHNEFQGHACRKNNGKWKDI